MSRIAIVTGASSGLGREFVRLIDGGSAGAVDEIWAIARRADRLDALVRTCKTPVRPLCLDLTDPTSFDVLEAALAEAEAPEVALLVNNAGAGTFGPFALQRKDSAPSMGALLMRAPVELIFRTLPYMRAGSRIINVSSVAAFAPQPGLSVYSACKRFILDLTQSLDAELGDVGIHATAVCPKFMKTGFLDHPGDRETLRKMMKIGCERPERVAAVALRASRAGRRLCIPAPDMKLFYAASRVLPHRLLLAAEHALEII